MGMERLLVAKKTAKGFVSAADSDFEQSPVLFGSICSHWVKC
jgi:hypothetical protein